MKVGNMQRSRNGEFLVTRLIKISCMIFTLVVGSALALPAAAQTTKPEWRFTAPLPLPLAGHAGVTLHTGEVLVCGGVTGSGAATNSSYIFSNGVWTQTANQLQFARAYHALVAVRKPNGESLVFAIGGYGGATGNYSSLSSVEVLQFTSATKSWSWRMIGNLPAAVGNCAAAYDKKGYVVISGGRIQTNGPLNSGTPTTISARINVNSLAIERIGAMATARSEHATLMLNGAKNDSTILTASGEQTTTPATELLNITTWDARANPPAFMQRFASNITDLAEVARMVGGIDSSGKPTNRGQWYDTKSGWRPMPRMQTPRAKAPMTLVAGIRDTTTNYLIAGGESTNAPTSGTEIFTQPGGSTPNGAWSPFAALNRGAAERTLSIDADNLAIVTGGSTPGVIAECEQFQPFSANDVDFGQQEIGGETQRLLVNVTNNWLLPVQLRTIRIPGSAEFRLVNSRDSVTIAPTSSLAIEVRFRPNTIGKRSAYLYFNAGSMVDSVLLTGEGIKSSIAVLTGLLDFGARRVLTDTTICFPAIKNEGKDSTVIDSIIVASSAFTLVSPLGRVKLPPDSTLTICIKFKPTARQLFGTGTIIHIADKAYPVSLTGSGIRAFITSTSQIGCDTVNVAPGDSLSYQLVVRNTSDLNVRIDSTIIQTALGGTFRLKTPQQFPVLLQPTESVTVDIVFRPQREATEQATVSFVNNGDTICVANLCFVPRNRTVNITIPQAQLYTLCEGDSLQLPIVLENPSNFETVRIDSVLVQGVGGYALGAVNVTLPPHTTTPATVILTPTILGAQQATIIVRTSQGASQSTVAMNLLPSMKFSIDTVSASVGFRSSVLVRRTDVITAINSTNLTVLYNGSVLTPRAIVNAPGKNYINTQLSTLTATSFGRANVSISWNAHPTTPDAVFAIEYDVLRGDDLRSSLSLESGAGNSVCVQQSPGEVIIDNLCGGRTALVTGKGVVMMTLSPLPVVDVATFQILAPSYQNAFVRLRSVLGDVVLSQQAAAKVSLDMLALSNGVYFCELIMDGRPILTLPITIMR